MTIGSGKRHFDNNEITQSGLGLDLAYDFSSGHTFQSITTYRDWEYETARDPVRLPLSVNDQIFNKQTDTWSQEFRLLSPSEETFEYVVGVYYYDEDFKSPETRDLGPDFCGTIVSQLELVGQVPTGTAAACAATPQDDAVVAEFSQTVESLAVYGQGTLHFNEQWSATAGARWTDDDLQGYYGSTTSNPVVAALAIASEPGRELEYTGDKTTWLAALQFSPTDDYLFYARYNTGYKSGGFNSDVPSTEPLTDDQRVFGPEDAKNIQVGGNTAWLDKRLFVNASVFRSEIDGFQDRAFDGTGFVTTNAGTLDVAGVEFELRARPVEPLYLSLGSVYLDSEFDSYPNAPNLPGLPGVQDLSGERNHFSPEWQWTAIGQWADAIPNTAMAWFTQAEWSYVDDQNIGATTDQNPQSVQDAYAVWNLRAGFGAADKRWEVMAYVENVGDERYCQVIFEQPFAAGLGVRDGEGNSLYRCVLGEPRTGGVRFTFRL